MNRLAQVLTALAFITPGAAHASLFDLRGAGWCTGDFPYLAVGDSISMVLQADQVDPVLRFDLEQEELTVCLRTVVTSTEVFMGYPWVHSTGTLYAFRDPARNSTFGEQPPNATAPATFVDGTAVWKVHVQDLVIVYDELTASGAFEAGMGAAAIDELGIPRRLDRAGRWLSGDLETTSANPGYAFSADAIVQESVLPYYSWLPHFELTNWSFASAGGGVLEVQGAFRGDSPPRLDPSQSEVWVSVGPWSVTLPTWAMAPDPIARVRTWSWTAPAATTGLQQLRYQFLGTLGWRFDLRVTGIPLEELLNPGRILTVKMHPVAWWYGEDAVNFDTPLEARGGTRKDWRHAFAAWHARTRTQPAPRSAPGVAAVSSHTPANDVVQLFDVSGRLVRTLPAGADYRAAAGDEPGTGQRLARGIYFVRLGGAPAPVARVLIR